MDPRLRSVLAAVAILTVTFGVIDSQAGRHRHRVVVKYDVAKATLPANDVESVAARCPRGYRAVGGGYTSDVIAVFPFADLGTTGYGAIAINQTNPPQAGEITATVACLRGKTTARNASVGRARLERLEQRYREQR